MTRVQKLKTVLESMCDDSDIYVRGIHNKYAARPNQLESLVLAEFVADYTIVPSKST